jgi:1-acyl-sn-glycerol-3-phosphate acyltransferase
LIRYSQRFFWRSSAAALRVYGGVVKRARKVFRLSALIAILALYFAVAPFGYGAFALLQLLQLFPATRVDAMQRAHMLQGIMRRAFRLLHDLLRWSRLIDFNARTPIGAMPEGAAVLVANHPGFLDVTALMASVENLTTAVKPVLYRRRWWRPLLDGARLFEGAADALDSAHVVEAATDRLREGFRVLIFPEGTRSPRSSPPALHKFGRTAFEVACRANVPVVPLVLDFEPVWLGKNQGILALPDQTPRLRVRALPAVWPADCGFSSRKLRDEVEAHLRSQLGLSEVLAGQHRAETPGHNRDERNGSERHGSERHGNGNARRIPRVPTQEADRGSADSGGSQARGHRDGGAALR